MSGRKLHYLLICFLCLFILQSQVFAQNANKPEDLIHFGDLVDVDIVGSTDYDWRGTLTPEGFLNGLDFIEPVYGLCRSEEQVAADIAKGYGKLLRDPQVVVKILDRSGRPATFLYGAIKTPQRFLIKRQINLNELIILSGGLTDRASGEIQIIRPGNLNCEGESNQVSPQTSESQISQKNFVTVKNTQGSQTFNIKIGDLLKGEKNANPLILSGDLITVLESAPIYIIGGVINPKQINASSQMTLSRAIASAGGFSKNADTKNITVFRRENGAVKTIELNFEKIKAGQAEDLVLQKLDIVDVSQSGSEKRKFPPVIKTENGNEKKVAEMPLKIVD